MSSDKSLLVSDSIKKVERGFRGSLSEMIVTKKKNGGENNYIKLTDPTE